MANMSLDDLVQIIQSPDKKFRRTALIIGLNGSRILTGHGTAPYILKEIIGKYELKNQALNSVWDAWNGMAKDIRLAKVEKLSRPNPDVMAEPRALEAIATLIRSGVLTWIIQSDCSEHVLNWLLRQNPEAKAPIRGSLPSLKFKTAENLIKHQPIRYINLGELLWFDLDRSANDEELEAPVLECLLEEMKKIEVFLIWGWARHNSDLVKLFPNVWKKDGQRAFVLGHGTDLMNVGKFGECHPAPKLTMVLDPNPPEGSDKSLLPSAAFLEQLARKLTAPKRPEIAKKKILKKQRRVGQPSLEPVFPNWATDEYREAWDREWLLPFNLLSEVNWDECVVLLLGADGSGVREKLAERYSREWEPSSIPSPTLTATTVPRVSLRFLPHSLAVSERNTVGGPKRIVIQLDTSADEGREEAVRAISSILKTLTKGSDRLMIVAPPVSIAQLAEALKPWHSDDPRLVVLYLRSDAIVNDSSVASLIEANKVNMRESVKSKTTAKEMSKNLAQRMTETVKGSARFQDANADRGIDFLHQALKMWIEQVGQFDARSADAIDLLSYWNALLGIDTQLNEEEIALNERPRLDDKTSDDDLDLNPRARG